MQALAHPLSAPTATLRVLVVVSAPALARSVADQLEQAGCRVLGPVSDAAAALRLVARTPPDLVLLEHDAGPDPGSASALAQRLRAASGLPVIFWADVAGDEALERDLLAQPYGYLPKPFSERELRTALAMAAYKMRAEARLGDSTRKLSTLSQRVLQAQESERRRLAVELHDELGQVLTALKINLQMAQRLPAGQVGALAADNLALVESALGQVRTLATGLRPALLDDLGLAPALRWMAEQAAARSGYAVEVFIDRGMPRLAAEVETALFRIAQEALTNIGRYAQARRVSIQLSHPAALVQLDVADDGVGFDVAAALLAAREGSSLGLLGMQERAMLIGGQLQISASPSGGTHLCLRAPWHALAPAAEPAGAAAQTADSPQAAQAPLAQPDRAPQRAPGQPATVA